jgi:hypothetical protein
MVNVMKGVGRAPCTPHPQQPGLILLNVRQNAVTTVYTLWRKALGRRAPHPPTSLAPQYSLPRGGHCSPGNSLNRVSSVGWGGGRETNKSWLFLFWPIGSGTSLVLWNLYRWHSLLWWSLSSGGLCVCAAKAIAKINAIETNLTL